MQLDWHERPIANWVALGSMNRRYLTMRTDHETTKLFINRADNCGDVLVDEFDWTHDAHRAAQYYEDHGLWPDKKMLGE